jgi:exopolysaccharide biosynthesis polyprenyl glycosylphosphotransferase
MARARVDLLRGLALLGDALALCLAAAVAYELRFESGLLDGWLGLPERPAPSSAYRAAMPVAVLVGLAALGLCGCYRGLFGRLTGRRLGELWRGVALAMLALLALSALVRGASYSRAVFALFALAFAVSLPLARLLLAALVSSAARRGLGRRRAVLIGGAREAARLEAELLARPELGVELVGFVAVPGEAAGAPVPEAPRVGVLGELAEVLGRERLDEAYVALAWEQGARLIEIEELLRGAAIDLHIALDVGGVMALRPSLTEIGRVPLWTLREGPGHGWSSFVKRAFDISFGAGVALITLPLMVFIAAALRLSSGPSVLYRQTRVSWGGRPFVMYKFRTMSLDAERDGPRMTSLGDPRRTRFGAVLRRLSLDELPQLFNVLKGDMSLVGPRPERPEFLPEIARLLPHFPLRHTVKAGMTGWAQVHGLRGASSFAERLQFDLDYVQRWSLILDLDILARTACGGFLSPHEG